MTSNSKAAGRFGKQDFRYVAAEDAYVCPSGQRLAYSFTTKDKDLVLRRYRTNACQGCAIKGSCTTGKERLISRWEHEAVLETVQARLDHHPEKMTMRRQTAEHPFGTIKCWMGATHFLMKGLPRVATEMALNVLAYNMKRVMAIIGVVRLIEVFAVEPQDLRDEINPCSMPQGASRAVRVLILRGLAFRDYKTHCRAKDWR